MDFRAKYQQIPDYNLLYEWGLNLLKGKSNYCQFTVAVRARGYLQRNLIIIVGEELE